MPSYRPVTAALRVLEVLSAVNRAGERANLGELHRLTCIDKATIVRMLETLTHAGFVVRDEERSIYRATGKTLQLSAGYDRHTVISAIIADDLRDFRHKVGWPSDVAVFDRDAMIVVETSRAAELLQFRRSPGFRAQVLVTSIGLAYLANCPADERDAFIARAAVSPSPDCDPARRPAELAKRLERVRADGFATMEERYSRENYDSQFFSIGVAIMNSEQIFGAINIVYLRAALTPESARKRLLGPLQDVARIMAAKLARHAERRKPAGRRHAKALIQIGGGDAGDGNAAIARKLIEAEGEPALLGPREVQLCRLTHRPAEPLIDAQQHGRDDDPRPVRSKVDEKRNGKRRDSARE